MKTGIRGFIMVLNNRVWSLSSDNLIGVCVSTWVSCGADYAMDNIVLVVLIV